MLYEEKSKTQEFEGQYRTTVVLALKTIYGIEVSDNGYAIQYDKQITKTQLLIIEVGLMYQADTRYLVLGFDDFCWVLGITELKDYYQQVKPSVDLDSGFPQFDISLAVAYPLCTHALALNSKGVAWYWVCDLPADSKLKMVLTNYFVVSIIYEDVVSTKDVARWLI